MHMYGHTGVATTTADKQEVLDPQGEQADWASM